MIFYPDEYLTNVKEIKSDNLKEKNIEALILDVDNTLIDLDKNILFGLDEWANEMKNNNIKLCILSNTNKIEKVTKVASYLNLQYINFAKKPCKSGFRKAMKMLNINDSKKIGVVGDQIFTDVFGRQQNENVYYFN